MRGGAALFLRGGAGRGGAPNPDIDQRTNDCEDDAGDDEEDSDGDCSAGVPQASSCDPTVGTMMEVIIKLFLMKIGLLIIVVKMLVMGRSRGW